MFNNRYYFITMTQQNIWLESSGVLISLLSRMLSYWRKGGLFDHFEEFVTSLIGLYGKMCRRPRDSQCFPFSCFLKSSLRQGIQHHASDVFPLKTIQTFRRQVQAYLTLQLWLTLVPSWTRVCKTTWAFSWKLLWNQTLNSLRGRSGSSKKWDWNDTCTVVPKGRLQIGKLVV